MLPCHTELRRGSIGEGTGIVAMSIRGGCQLDGMSSRGPRGYVGSGRLH